jgi:predicted RND superfamily exporter protein
MSWIDRLTAAITEYSRVAIAIMLVLTVVVGAGAGMVEQSSSLDQFQSETTESQKLDYINENFQTEGQNTTSAQLILRGEDVLSKDALLAQLRTEQAFLQDETINPTLAEEQPVYGVANVIAVGAIQQEQAQKVQATAAEVQQLNATVQQEQAALAELGASLDARSQTLNETTVALRSALDTLRADTNADVRAAFEEVSTETAVEFTEEDYATFQRAADQLRNATSQQDAKRAYELGTEGVLADQFQDLNERSKTLEERKTALGEQAAELDNLAGTLQEQRATLQNASRASLDEQLTQLESMNASQIDATVEAVLSGDGQSSGALAFMPTYYEPGETTTNATMLLVTQQSSGSAAGGAASDAVVDAQLAMEDLAKQTIDSTEVLVFGSGIISEEINASMSDSLLIVGPLALLFVFLALAIAYRDVIDIVLGLFGIGAVLVWTFGFMGWAGIAFNQLFVAVPVLLIGLSIDYAIHIFMRHREERHNDDTPSTATGAMKVALTGVGVALTWVTATTVIGFLSNLSSPVPPIQDFGVVSAVGITAALLVFGVLIPALKLEIDSFLEGRGWDRKKRAFGTGGGRFSDVLSVGATAARKAPFAVLLLAVVLSGAAAFGGAQVDTTFNQEDFLAEDPADWQKDLPEPFAPGEYSAKQNLEYVNQNFLRQDSQAQILVEGDLTDPGALAGINAGVDAAGSSPVSKKLSNGEANIRGPVSAIQQAATNNEAFAETVAAADPDNDGIPEENLDTVFAELFTVAPQQAAGVIQRTDGGEYVAGRLIISTSGTASGSDVTSEMRAVANDIESEGSLTATATGQTILFKIVQDQLLNTVIESLLITLVAVFAFLMLTYRLTEGSATLGAVTLLPVVFSVTWILGTMYLLDIPFNILTGMITSLTVGLGVAYSIHLSERYNQELERTNSMWTSMNRAVTGTGGALLGSAATTVGGFGVLAFAILPPLRQFGIITGLTIIYAFLASVLVLPSLLVIWTRYIGPTVDESATTVSDSTPATED